VEKNGTGNLTAQHIDTYERIKYQIQQLHSDINALSKKKPDGPINKFKLSFVNEKIADANSLLGDTFKPSRNFETFDKDDLPSNSDVVLILSQYLDALEAWRSANVKKIGYDWFWDTSDDSKIESRSPSRYRSSSSDLGEK
jgi:hypothetical protein